MEVLLVISYSFTLHSNLSIVPAAKKSQPVLTIFRVSMKKIYLVLREILEKKPGIYAILTFGITLIVTSAAAFRMYELTAEEERQKAFYAADALRDQIELTLNYGLSATQTIALLIEHGSAEKDFEQVAEKTLQAYPVLDAVELGLNGVVNRVYPFEQNKAAIGFNILGDSIQKAEAAEAIKKQKLIFAGPLRLVQGGIGVVGRLPVFISTTKGNRFWGFSLVVIKIDRLLTIAKSNELTSRGYNFQLRRVVFSSSTIDTFFNKHLSLRDPVILNITVPNGHWELHVAPTSGWNASKEIVPFAATRVLLSCLFGLFVWYIGKQPQRLSRLVSKRTEELKFSDAKFQSYVENAPNIITIIDANGMIKYLNRTEPGTSLKDYIGNNIFNIILKKHHAEVRYAINNTLQTHAMSYYLTSATVNNEHYWFENMVGLLNPNNANSDLIITATNISERIKTEDEIRRKGDENKFLAGASAILSECGSEEEVYSLISSLLVQLIPGSSIFVMRTSPDGQRSTLMNVGGVESSVLSFGMNILKFNPIGMSYDNVPGYAELFCKPQLHKFNGGLYELACGYLPKFAAEQIEKLLHVSAFYSIGIAQENSYLGYIHILTKNDITVNPAIVESFVHQCHLALSKIISQRALFEEAQRRRIMMNTSGDGMALIDQEHSVIECNLRFAEMIGYTMDEVTSLHTWNWDAKMTEMDIRKTFSDLTKINMTFESSHRRKDGSTYDVEVSANGTMVGGKPMVFVVCRDISFRKQSENAVRESEEKLRQIFTVMEEGLALNELIYGESGEIINYRILEVNPAFEHISKLSRDNFVGKLATDVYKTSSEYIKTFWKQHHNSSHAIKMDYYDEQSNNWIHVSTSKPIAGKFVTSFFDITELKQTEKALRESEAYNKAIINTVPDLLFVHDSSGNIIDYHAPETIPLFIPPKDFLGKHFREFLPPDVVPIVEKSFNEAVQSQKMSIYTYSLPLPDGKRHYEARLLTFEGDKVLNIIRDITEKVNAENEIKTLNADLEGRVERRTAQLTDAVGELEAFSYSVSHDLRAPLRSIDGYTTILSEQYKEMFDDEGKRLLSNVHASIDKMDRLIKGLLTLSRVGRSELRFIEQSMDQIILKTFEECSTEKFRMKAEFKLLPLPTVFVDLTLIQQVWTNLISNAVKYSANREHPYIEIGGEKKGETIIFYIKDNGAGFNPQYSNKLFGIFQRLHVDEEFKGLGIGLSIVKRVVQRHGGTVWAEGKVNEGATFYFSIPQTIPEQ